MIETIDRANSLIRREYKTNDPKKCRQYIESLDCITQKFNGSRVVRYIANMNGPIEIVSTPTKTVIKGRKTSALNEIDSHLHTEEWEV